MVAWQLHDKRRGAACEELGLFEHDAADDDGDNAQEVEERCNPRGFGVADERAHDKRDDGQLGAAGDERGGHDRHAAVLLVLDGLGGKHARHAAAGGHQHGDEGLTGQAKAAEDSVHNKSDARHVAAILKEGEQDKEDEHLRDEAQNGTHAGNDAVADQGDHHIAGARSGKPALEQRGDAGHGGTKEVPAVAEEVVVHPIGHGGAERGDGQVVHAEHDGGEDRQTQPAICDDAVYLLRGAHLGGCAMQALIDDMGDDGIALTGDNGFRVIVAVGFALGDEGFDLLRGSVRQLDC